MHNLMLQTSEETIGRLCGEVLGRKDGVEKVKKTEDYAFVHFQERADAAKCMEALRGERGRILGVLGGFGWNGFSGFGWVWVGLGGMVWVGWFGWKRGPNGVFWVR